VKELSPVFAISILSHGPYISLAGIFKKALQTAATCLPLYLTSKILSSRLSPSASNRI
jgi:hypothetical protein